MAKCNWRHVIAKLGILGQNLGDLGQSLSVRFLPVGTMCAFPANRFDFSSNRLPVPSTVYIPVQCIAQNVRTYIRITVVTDHNMVSC